MSETTVAEYTIVHTGENIQYITGIAHMNQRFNCIITMAQEIIKMRELLQAVADSRFTTDTVVDAVIKAREYITNLPR